MNAETRFAVHGEPLGRSLSSLGSRGITTLFAFGIVNPFGPTLDAFVLDGEPAPGGSLPILHLVLHPFAPEVMEVGTAWIGESWDPLLTMPLLFEVTLGCCPTLLIPGRMLSPDAAALLFARLLARFDDGYSVCEAVRRSRGDTQRRLQQELTAALELLTERSSTGDAAVTDDRRLTHQEASALSMFLLEPARQCAELEAFLYAWDGSVAVQTDAFGEDAMSLSAFLAYFAMLARTCIAPKQIAAKFIAPASPGRRRRR